MRLKILFATLVVGLSLLTYTPGLAAAGGDGKGKGPKPDPACVDACVLELRECFFAGGTEHQCGVVYHRCLGQCGH